MNVMKSTFVTATIPDEIPVEFAVYDLNEFLSAHSLMDNCEIIFEDDKMVFQDGNQKTYYFFSSPSVVVSPGDKKITLPSEDKKFLLSKEVFDKILRNSNVMKLKDLTIDCNGVKIWNRNNVGNQHHIQIPVECTEPSQPSLIKVENLKLIPVDYDVAISNKGLARFTSRSEEYRIEYWIALDLDE